MKLYKKLLGTIILGAAALSLAACVSFDYYPDADKYLVGTQYYDGELKTLDIDWISGSVTLIQDETADQITVKEDNNLDDDRKVHSYFHDGILSVKYCKSGLRFGNVKSIDKQLFVTFPSLETLDLSSWNTNNVTNMSYMFTNDYKLETIYASERFVTNEI